MDKIDPTKLQKKVVKITQLRLPQIKPNYSAIKKGQKPLSY